MKEYAYVKPRIEAMHAASSQELTYRATCDQSSLKSGSKRKDMWWKMGMSEELLCGGEAGYLPIKGDKDE